MSVAGESPFDASAPLDVGPGEASIFDASAPLGDGATTPWLALLRLPGAMRSWHGSTFGEHTFVGSNFWLFLGTFLVVVISLASVLSRWQPAGRLMRSAWSLRHYPAAGAVVIASALLAHDSVARLLMPHELFVLEASQQRLQACEAAPTHQ